MAVKECKFRDDGLCVFSGDLDCDYCDYNPEEHERRAAAPFVMNARGLWEKDFTTVGIPRLSGKKLVDGERLNCPHCGRNIGTLTESGELRNKCRYCWNCGRRMNWQRFKADRRIKNG